MDTKSKAKHIVQESLDEAVNWGSVGRNFGSRIAVTSNYLYKILKPIIKLAVRKSMQLISSAGFKVGEYFNSKVENSVADCFVKNNKTEVENTIKKSLKTTITK